MRNGLLRTLPLLISLFFSRAYPMDSLRVRLLGRELPGPCKGIFVVGSRGYVGSGGMFAVVSFSSPSNPSIMGKCFLPGLINDIYVSGNYAYVACGEAGVRVVNLVDPYRPTEVGRYTDMNYANGIYVRADTCFVASDADGLYLLNVSVPSSPTFIRRFPTAGEAEGIFDIPGTAYVAAGQLGFWIRPHIAGGSEYYYNFGGFGMDLYVVSNLAYVAGQSAGLIVLDKSDPSSIIERGFYPTIGDANDVVVSGSYAYLASGWDGFYILNIYNPSNITEVGAVYLYGDPFHIFYLSPYAYIADRIYGLYIVNCTNPNSPSITGTLKLRGTATRVGLSGTRLYVAHEYGGLRVVDISSLTQPREIGYTMSYPVYGIGVNGSYVLAACGTNGLRIFDASDPGYIIETGYFDMGGNIVDLAVRAPYAYVVDKWYGLYVVDISNPIVPTLVGSISGSGFSRVSLYGNYAFVSARSYGLKIINVQNPASPTLITTYTNGANIMSSYPTSNRVYLAKGSAGFEIVDIQNIGSPVRLGYYISTGFVEDIAVMGNFAFLASGEKGLEVLRIDEPSNIRLVGYYDTGDYALSLVVRQTDTTVFLADSWDGLWILDASDVYLNVERSERKEEKISLVEVYPSPFNLSANIVVELKEDAFVELSVLNLLGERVLSLYNGRLSMGRHSFDWKLDNSWTSGLYFVVVKTGRSKLMARAIVLK